MHGNNTEIFSQLFYSLFIILHCILWKSYSKASRLLFIFFHISMGHAHFVNNEIHISCDPDSLTYIKVLSSCITPEKWAKKAKLKVCGKLPHPDIRTFEPKLMGSGAYRGFVLLYFVHTGCIYHLRICSLGQCEWTNKHWYRHTFRKIIN